MALPDTHRRFRQHNGGLSSNCACCKQQLTDSGYQVDTLSMGMTNDMQAAIAEGATIVRIGTALFGPRTR